MDALHDLTYAARQKFVETHPLPNFGKLPLVSFHSSTESPTSAFFLTARYVRRRYEEPSDGMVACRDAEVPGSVVVRYNATDMDHLGPIYPAVPLTPGPLRIGFSRDGVLSGADICEALVRLLFLHKQAAPLTAPLPSLKRSSALISQRYAAKQQGAIQSANLKYLKHAYRR